MFNIQFHSTTVPHSISLFFRSRIGTFSIGAPYAATIRPFLDPVPGSPFYIIAIFIYFPYVPYIHLPRID